MLEFGGVGVKNNAGSKASLRTLSGGTSCGCLREEPHMGKGPDGKGPCFSVSPGGHGQDTSMWVYPRGLGTRPAPGSPQRTLLMAEGGESSRQRRVRGM